MYFLKAAWTTKLLWLVKFEKLLRIKVDHMHTFVSYFALLCENARQEIYTLVRITSFLKAKKRKL